MFLLDTNVISELRKLGDGKADARVAAWVSGRDASSFYISALTLMELEIGILRIERRDAVQGERLRTWMDRYVLPEFLERTLPVDAAVAPEMRAAACARSPGRTRRADRSNGHRARDGCRHGKRCRLRDNGCGGHRSMGRRMSRSHVSVLSLARNRRGGNIAGFRD